MCEWMFSMTTVDMSTSTPIAMGELYVNPNEYVPLIKDRLIDFIRVHLSDIGGITPARDVTLFANMYGLRTAGPIAIGMSRVPVPRFVLLNTLGAVLLGHVFYNYSVVLRIVGGLGGGPGRKSGAVEVREVHTSCGQLAFISTRLPSSMPASAL